MRLPFEPKGEVRAMRDALKVALASLRGDGLHAVFGGAAGASFDLENVLFYNVGCAAFRPGAHSSLYFERQFNAEISPSGRRWAWSHRYQTTPLAKSWVPVSGGVEVVLRGTGGLPKSAGEYWLVTGMARGEAPDPLPLDAPLLLKLKLNSSSRVNLTDAVKKMTDGICSAMHSYVGSDVDAVAVRIGLLLGMDSNKARSRLLRPGALGPKRFVWLYGQKVQWSPSDERLVAVEMSWAPSESRDWSVGVALSEARLVVTSVTR